MYARDKHSHTLELMHCLPDLSHKLVEVRKEFIEQAGLPSVIPRAHDSSMLVPNSLLRKQRDKHTGQNLQLQIH